MLIDQCSRGLSPGIAGKLAQVNARVTAVQHAMKNVQYSLLIQPWLHVCVVQA